MWKKVRLGNILTESKIESLKSDPDKRITVRLNMKGVEKRPYEQGVEGGTKYFVRKAGQFIYGKQNLFKGAFGIVPKELDQYESSLDIPTFDVDKSCLPEWLIFFLKQGDFYKTLESIATGTGSRRIQPSRLFDIEIPLPNINEQKKIIRHCSNAEAKFEQINTELDFQQSCLNLLRQSILQEAVQGKLVPQDTSDEPAEQLLQRIKAEKARLVKEGKLKKEKELPPITEEEIPFELPKGWVWCRMGEICCNVDYGTSEKATSHGEVPVLRMGNIQDGELVYSNLKYVSKDIKDLPKLYLKNKDLVFNRTNSFELVGKAGIYNGNEKEFTLASYLIRVSLPTDLISVEFVNIYINSTICRQTQIEPQITQQTGQANFSGSKLKNIIFPLPPHFEQQRIIAKVKRLLHSTTNLEEQVLQSKGQSQHLLQTILREAFAGEQKEYAENEMLTMAAEE